MSKNNFCVGFVGIRVSTFVLLSAIMVLLLSAIACSSSGTDDPAVPTVSVSSSASSMTYSADPPATIDLSASLANGNATDGYEWTVEPKTAGTVKPANDNTATFALENVGSGTVVISAETTSGGKAYTGSITISLNKAAYGGTKPVVYDTTQVDIALGEGAVAKIDINTDNRAMMADGNNIFFPKDPSLTIARTAGSAAMIATVDNQTGTITFKNESAIVVTDTHTFTLTYTDDNYEDFTLDFTVSPDESKGVLQITAVPETMTYGATATATLTASAGAGVTATTYTWAIAPQIAGSITPGTDTSTAVFTLENAGTGSVTISATMVVDAGTASEKEYSGSVTITLNKAPAYPDPKPLVYGTKTTSIGVTQDAEAKIAITSDNRDQFSPQGPLSITTDSTAISASVDNDTGEITFSVTDASSISAGVAHSFTLIYTDNNYEALTLDFTVTPNNNDISGYDLSYNAKGSIGKPLDAGPIWDATPPATYKIAPALPSGLGLTFDTQTGKITGSPTTGSWGLYTVTATGSGDYKGTIGTEISLAIFLDPVIENTDGIAIGTRAELEKIGRDNEYPLDGTYHLSANIDLGSANWEPLGSLDNPFTGVLHGNGYAIYNLKIEGLSGEAGNHQGLFAAIDGASKDGSDGIVENLAIGVKSIKGNAVVGALVGTLTGWETNITNIALVPMDSDAQIEALGSYTLPENTALIGANVGGIVGIYRGERVASTDPGTTFDIDDSSGEGMRLSGYNLGVKVSSVNSYVGGLIGHVGYAARTSLRGFSTADVSGGDYVGGVVGRSGSMDNGLKINAYATGTITGKDNVGGLAGRARNDIDAVARGYATGAVVGKDNVGGLLGGCDEGYAAGYATGKVKGNNSVGGLVGENLCVIIGYATGDVEGNDMVGGLVGNNFDGKLASGVDGTFGGISGGFVTGTVSGKSRVGGLVGNNVATAVGYAVGKVSLIEEGATSIGGFAGAIGNNTYPGPSGDVAYAVEVGYWDTGSTGQGNTFGKATGILTSNIGYTTDKGYSNDAEQPPVAIFNEEKFIAAFDLAGPSKTWPKLKESVVMGSEAGGAAGGELSFDPDLFIQPTVRADDDGKITVRMPE